MNHLSPDSSAQQGSNLEITKWRNNAAGALTLSFDDGYKKTWEYCSRYLAEYKLKSTWNIPTAFVGGTFEGREIISWSDANKIAQVSGAEIASHSMNHLSSSMSRAEYLLKVPTEFIYASSKLGYVRQMINLPFKLLAREKSGEISLKKPSPDIEREVTDSKAEIDAHVAGQSALSYVFPYGKHDVHYKDCVRSGGYICARSTFKGYNIIDKLDLFALQSMTWVKQTTLKEADKWVCTAMAKGAWLIETYHLVAQDDPGYKWFTPVGVFRQHIEHISSLANNNSIWVDTQQNVTKYILQRASSKATILRRDSDCFVLGLHNSVGRFPEVELTLKVGIASHWHQIEVSQGGRLIYVHKDKDFIVFNTLPNNGDISIKGIR